MKYKCIKTCEQTTIRNILDGIPVFKYTTYYKNKIYTYAPIGINHNFIEYDVVKERKDKLKKLKLTSI
jgi:hypothetical protein